MGDADFSREQASALADLQFHWDERYVIAFDGDVWSARWRAGGDELTAGSAEDLRQLIREDHARRRHDDYVGLRERMST